jgi:hypothetical protein
MLTLIALEFEMIVFYADMHFASTFFTLLYTLHSIASTTLTHLLCCEFTGHTNPVSILDTVPLIKQSKHIRYPTSCIISPHEAITVSLLKDKPALGTDEFGLTHIEYV